MYTHPCIVYHILSPDQLNRWDQLEQEYYGGEITRQGLEKKRKQLFIEAGLLRDPKEMKALQQEDQRVFPGSCVCS